LAGIERGLRNDNGFAAVVAEEFSGIFRSGEIFGQVSQPLLQRMFEVLSQAPEPSARSIFGFESWLNALAMRDPPAAISATERYLAFVGHHNRLDSDRGKNLGQLLTRLFAQAEEQEEADGGQMLHQVVHVQDTMLALGVGGVSDWLQAAERAQG